MLVNTQGDRHGIHVYRKKICCALTRSCQFLAHTLWRKKEVRRKQMNIDSSCPLKTNLDFYYLGLFRNSPDWVTSLFHSIWDSADIRTFTFEAPSECEHIENIRANKEKTERVEKNNYAHCRATVTCLTLQQEKMADWFPWAEDSQRNSLVHWVWSVASRHTAGRPEKTLS